MKLQKLFIFILISLPLIPILVLPTGTLTDPLTSTEVTTSIPFILELFALYGVSLFVKNHHHSFSKDEQRSMMVLACGGFWILGLPVVISAPFVQDLGYPVWALYLLMIYSFINLVISIKQVSTSASSINRYFLRRYLLPGGLAALLTLMIFGGLAISTNGMVLYYLIKNLIYVFGTKRKVPSKAHSAKLSR